MPRTSDNWKCEVLFHARGKTAQIMTSSQVEEAELRWLESPRSLVSSHAGRASRSSLQEIEDHPR